MAGIDSGIALGDSIAKYPLNADEQQEIELWLNIRAFSFTRLKALRTLEIGEQKCNMWLPMPTKMETGTSISYNSGQANEGKLTKAINSVASIGSIGDLFTGVVGWFESVTGVANAIGKRDMDQRESVFNGAGLRSHSFDWTLVPKDSASSARIFSMAYRLNALAYPGAAAQTSSMYHPPLFTIGVFQGSAGSNGKGRTEWSMDPQLCVLKSCSIDRSGAGAAYSVGSNDFLPAVWKISLEFTEFEPLVRSMVNDRLVSRSVSDTVGLADAFINQI
tara:strand:+ start:1780 stop:2607 length:828 start_codon:yes stop_codon:yes gene_type:complete